MVKHLNNHEILYHVLSCDSLESYAVLPWLLVLSPHDSSLSLCLPCSRASLTCISWLRAKCLWASMRNLAFQEKNPVKAQQNKQCRCFKRMLKGLKTKSAKSGTWCRRQLCLFSSEPGGIKEVVSLHLWLAWFPWEHPDWLESAFGAKVVDGEDKWAGERGRGHEREGVCGTPFRVVLFKEEDYPKGDPVFRFWMWFFSLLSVFCGRYFIALDVLFKTNADD